MGTNIKYKKNNRYTKVASLYLLLCSGMFGLSPSKFYWIIISKTTSKWGYDFDETLVELARNNPTSRFYNKIKAIDEDTVLYHAEPVTEKLTVGTATNDVMAVAEFIYATDDIFADKWKDQKIAEIKPEVSETNFAVEMNSIEKSVNKPVSREMQNPMPTV
jgi:hypothetical protein